MLVEYIAREQFDRIDALKRAIHRERYPAKADINYMANILYVLTNAAMPGLVKIGITTDDVETRIAQLTSHSGVPLPFECYFAADVPNAQVLERKLHQLFSENRINPKREFFKVDPERIVLAISIGSFKEITPGKVDVDPIEIEALERIKSRRPRIKLEALGIMPGAMLQFSRDENLIATVTDGGRIIFEGQDTSLSAAALMILNRMGYKTTSVSGSDYWMFEGELLDERRIRLESAQFEEAA